MAAPIHGLCLRLEGQFGRKSYPFEGTLVSPYPQSTETLPRRILDWSSVWDWSIICAVLCLYVLQLQGAACEGGTTICNTRMRKTYAGIGPRRGAKHHHRRHH